MSTIRFNLSRKFALACAVMALTSALPGMIRAAGLLKSKTGAAGKVQMVSHKVRVVINNGFSMTEVDQVFENRGDHDLETIYSFPLPQAASMSELSLWIDGRESIGEVLPKEKAREVYNEQTARGADAALTEKNDFKTFETFIGRVPAGAQTRVRMVYYQPVEIDSHVGRYVYPLSEGRVDEERMKFWQVDDQVDGAFRFDLSVKSAFPLKDVRIPGHMDEAVIARRAPDAESAGDSFDVMLDKPGGMRLNQDLVVYYRLDENVPARVELIPYRPSSKEKGTLMVVITPAADLKTIEEGTDWIFVLDISGSMKDGKIATLCDGVSRALGKLQPRDRFRIITFNHNVKELTSGFIQATPENASHGIVAVRKLQAHGRTALYDALKKACQVLDRERTAAVILATDGVCNVGPTAHDAFIELLRKVDVRLFTFVLGNGANRPLMERLANDSGGFAMQLSDQDDMYGRLLQARVKMGHMCMHDLSLSFKGARITDLTPADPGSLYAGEQLVMFGRYDQAGVVDMTLRARVSGEQKSWHCKMTLPEKDTDNPELERLWALSRIEEEMQDIRAKGETAAKRDAIVDLGSTYSLVTDYTSMLVVNDQAHEEHGIDNRNATRVMREREARQQRGQAPVKSYRRDAGQQTFQNRPTPHIGSGPVSPFFLLLLPLLAAIKRWSAKKDV